MQRIVTRWRWAVVTAGAVLMAGLPLLRGQEPKQVKEGPRVEPPKAAAARAYEPAAVAARLKPLPLESIPDNPPPHEGALFRIADRIESPDLILVEVLEALPGRPITGERLVRPDGTISLQWYGDVQVAGLTIEQAKEKIVIHLRQYLSDQALGLVEWSELGDVRPDQAGVRPLDPLPPGPPPNEPAVAGHPQPVKPPEEGAGSKPEGLPAGQPTTASPATAKEPEKPRSYFPKNSNAAPVLRQPVPPHPPAAVELVPGGPADLGFPVGAAGPPAIPGGGVFVDVVPARTPRVFVDITGYNSAVYFVEGEVGNPGRFPCTGNDTVYDAIAYAGRLLPSANRLNIHLNRPARGDKPIRSYKIDMEAIERGEKKANLQVFPGDRLLIGRKGQVAPEDLK